MRQATRSVFSLCLWFSPPLHLAQAIVASILFASCVAHAEDWPRWRGPRSDGTWQAPAGIPDQWPAGGPQKVWTVPLNPGYSGISRAKIVGTTWAHPAYAGNCVFARDDEQLVCIRLTTP